MKKKHRLYHWYKNSKRTKRDICSELGIGLMTFERCMNGTLPKADVLDRLAILTNGEIDANSWHGEEAAKVIAARRTALV